MGWLAPANSERFQLFGPPSATDTVIHKQAQPSTGFLFILFNSLTKKMAIKRMVSNMQEKTFLVVDNLCLSFCHPVVYRSVSRPLHRDNYAAQIKAATNKPIKSISFL